jgi:predicted AAA+ superfamily ATPase
VAALLSKIVDRRLNEVVSRRMELEPVVVLQGPRAVGKSTLLRTLAAARGAEVIDLDDLSTRDAVVADPALPRWRSRPLHASSFAICEAW